MPSSICFRLIQGPSTKYALQPSSICAPLLKLYHPVSPGFTKQKTLCALRTLPGGFLPLDARIGEYTLMEEEASYQCGSCGERIVIPIDPSAGTHQEYVEDCPVCCHPNVIHVELDSKGEADTWAEPE